MLCYRKITTKLLVKKKLNDDRRKRGLPPVTLIIKDGKRWFVSNQQIRDKFYHFPDVFGSETSPSLPKKTLKKLETLDGVSYNDRKKVLRSKSILPEKYIKAAGGDLRAVVLDSNTIVKSGTLGKNMESFGIGKSSEGYILYNEKTNTAMFFDSQGFRTAIRPTRQQINDLRDNNNML